MKKSFIILFALTSCFMANAQTPEQKIEQARALARSRVQKTEQAIDSTKKAVPVNQAFEQALKEQKLAEQAQSETAIAVNAGETAIADSAFYKKLELKELTLPASVQKLGRHCIDHCYKLTKVTVDKDNPYLKSVDGVIYSKDGSTLLLCTPSKKGEFVVPATVKTIAPAAFSTCKKITSIVLPKGIEEIPDEAFQGCWGLEKINLPEGLKRIGKRAFDGTIIQKINVPTTMEMIDDGAFINTSIVEVNLRVTEPFKLGEEVFREIHVTRLNVPEAGLKAFKKHPKWGKFGRITPTHSYWTVDLP